ncbi:hypothetical protein [Exiguobacterium mexicanum]|uniref:hypothetical protein n=1 Tax=Exiguobacterium mexicanum TaxID=340146 RepID=UPI00384DF7FE
MTYYLQGIDDDYEAVTLLSKKLIDATPDELVLTFGDNILLGVQGVKRKLQYIDDPSQLLSDYLSYTFILHNKDLEISLQIYENINNHFRINCFSKYGSKSGQLFSLNLTTSFENDLITFKQKIKFSDQIKGDTESAKLVRLRKQESINHYLRTNGYDIDDKSNELYLGMYDVKNNTFIDTTAEKLIHDFLTISILKGHYMGNKGYRFDTVPTIG